MKFTLERETFMCRDNNDKRLPHDEVFYVQISSHGYYGFVNQLHCQLCVPSGNRLEPAIRLWITH